MDSHPLGTARALAAALWRRVVWRPVGKLLHVARRRAALRRLSRRPGVRSILFLCHGNICRSPYAAGALRRLMSENSMPGLKIASAGFLGPGRSVPTNAIEAASRRGVDLTGHRSQRVDTRIISSADLVVVMDVAQERRVLAVYGRRPADVLLLADLLPAFRDARQIPDPVDQPLETFERVYDQIDDSLEALRDALMTDRGR